MNELIGVAALAVVAAALIALGWWLFIETEGVYLGRRVVVWLYDVYAGRYDDIKHFRTEYDHMFLAQPIMERIAPLKAPLVLDVATGTVRLPLSMLRHAHFQGRVVGVDLSRRMLAIGAGKLAGEPRVSLLWHDAARLPFDDDTFDVVTCVEALEFMSDPDAVARELARVLRPGGLLLTTNRLTGRMMPGKTRTEAQVRTLLTEAGIEDITFEIWQVDYIRVWGRKRGTSTPTLARPLAEILRCPNCRAALLVEREREWVCPQCGARYRTGDDGVIELARRG